MSSAKVVKMYKPVGLVLSTASGLAAGKAVRKTWQRVGQGGGAPTATDEERAWREILVAAAVQGAVTAVVKSAVTRAGATTTRRLTGTWPA